MAVKGPWCEQLSHGSQSPSSSSWEFTITHGAMGWLVLVQPHGRVIGSINHTWNSSIKDIPSQVNLEMEHQRFFMIFAIEKVVSRVMFAHALAFSREIPTRYVAPSWDMRWGTCAQLAVGS